ncbi:hypothetical protein GCM10009746_22420 [Microbacterium paludicola]
MRPLAGVICAPEAGPSARKSADRVARASSVGTSVCTGFDPPEWPDAVTAAEAAEGTRAATSDVAADRAMSAAGEGCRRRCEGKVVTRPTLAGATHARATIW